MAEHEGLGPAELTLSTGPLTPPPGCCRHPEPELLGPKAAPRSLLFLYFFFFPASSSKFRTAVFGWCLRDTCLSLRCKGLWEMQHLTSLASAVGRCPAEIQEVKGSLNPEEFRCCRTRVPGTVATAAFPRQDKRSAGRSQGREGRKAKT